MPESVRGFAQFVGHDLNSRPWDHLVDSVKTGQPAFDLVFGMPVFDYVTKQPESAAIFNEASFLDLEMLVVTQGGRERTEQEFQRLYGAAGFRISKVFAMRAPVSIVDGEAV